MKSDSTEQIRLLKEETVRIFGKSLDSPTDYDALAAEILEKTDKSISSTTLKRVFGYIKNGNAPTGATLGLLARYCGYAGWADWCAKHGAGTGTNGETGMSRARKVSITSISAAALLIAALLVWRPWAENTTAEQPAAISEPPAFEETDGETLRYQKRRDDYGRVLPVRHAGILEDTGRHEGHGRAVRGRCVQGQRYPAAHVLRTDIQYLPGSMPAALD